MKYQNSAHRRMHLSFLVTCVIIHTYIHTYSKEELTVTYLFVIWKSTLNSKETKHYKKQIKVFLKMYAKKEQE